MSTKNYNTNNTLKTEGEFLKKEEQSIMQFVPQSKNQPNVKPQKTKLSQKYKSTKPGNPKPHKTNLNSNTEITSKKQLLQSENNIPSSNHISQNGQVHEEKMDEDLQQIQKQECKPGDQPSINEIMVERKLSGIIKLPPIVRLETIPDQKQRIQKIKSLLQGKTTTLWIYAISTEISEELIVRIRQAYNGLNDEYRIVPFVRSAEEIKPFLQLKNTYFKIVVNIAIAEQALRLQANYAREILKNIVGYYIYNDEEELGMNLALQLKSKNIKIKGIYTNLQVIVEKTEEETAEEIQLSKDRGRVKLKLKKVKFPSFLKLSGEDKTQATLYRANLYGAIKIDANDKQKAFLDFLKQVKQTYNVKQHGQWLQELQKQQNPHNRQQRQKSKQQKDFEDYLQINHLKIIEKEQQARQIIRFYVRETFYYQILNSMLRVIKTTEQFKSCVLPFNETYHSVKYFYRQYLTQCNRKIPAMTLYRGAKIKNKDLQSLKQGIFIEMYGFMSTSKSLKQAKKFAGDKGHIFVIEVKKKEIAEKWDKYDHGFVDINKYQIAPKQYLIEEQVLFNPLNIYKVKEIKQQGPYTYIHLQYGAIFDLLEKPQKQLTSDEKGVLINYKYCTQLMERIEDQGDVHLVAGQYTQAQNYYQRKIQQINFFQSKSKKMGPQPLSIDYQEVAPVDDKNSNKNKYNYYLKLANVQKQSGQLEKAKQNIEISLKKIDSQKIDLSNKEDCLKVFSIHSKNAEINLQSEDYLTADQSITKAIEVVDDSDLLTKAVKLRERGDIKFKKGEIKDAEKDFGLCENLLITIEQQGKLKKWEAQKSYFLSILTLCFRNETMEQLQKKKDQELKEVQNNQNQIRKIRDQINSEFVKVNKSMKEVALYVGNKTHYEYCVKKGRDLLLRLLENQIKDVSTQAKIKAMRATIEGFSNLAESQKLLDEAIQLVESQTPYNPIVGEYATQLAKLQKISYQKYTRFQQLILNRTNQPLEYDSEQIQRIYNNCKSNFQKAIKVLLYNNKAKDSIQVVTIKNQLGQLEFQSNKFAQCIKIIAETRREAAKINHSQMSRGLLLLGKIAFCRGALRHSFQNLQQAENNLNKAIIKKKADPKYAAILQKNDIYLQISLAKSKVYHKQLKHDMSLMYLSMLMEKLKAKMDGYEGHNLLASVYQQMAEASAAKSQPSFSIKFQRAISLREKQLGKYNLLNGMSYCNYTIYLLLNKKIKEAYSKLNEAQKIFSCLNENHPLFWIICYARAYYYQQKGQYVKAEKILTTCLQRAKIKFNPSHITIKKVQLKLSKVLHKQKKYDESIRRLDQLKQNIITDLDVNQQQIAHIKQTDDEKVLLYKQIRLEKQSIQANKRKQRYQQSNSQMNLSINQV